MPMRIERFEDIEAWQLAREPTRKVYDLTKKAEFARDFGLKGQIQDAAGSSMHNIAEGFDSETNSEFVRFLRYA
jgi:four helix bundle protein